MILSRENFKYALLLSKLSSLFKCYRFSIILSFFIIVHYYYNTIRPYIRFLPMNIVFKYTAIFCSYLYCKMMVFQTFPYAGLVTRQKNEGVQNRLHFLLIKLSTLSSVLLCLTSESAHGLFTYISKLLI